MKKLLLLVLAVLSSLAMAGGDAGLLKAQALRRLNLIDSMRPLGVTDVLRELVLKLPEPAVLSRLSLEDGQWTIELRRGSKQDLEAALGSLVALQACAAPSVQQTPAGVVTGTCKAPGKPRWYLAKGVAPGAEPEPDVEAALKQKLLEAQSILPDSDVDRDLELQLSELGSKLRGITLAEAPKVTGPVSTQGPLDRFGLTLRGSADFADAVLMLTGLESLRRKVVIEAFDFQNPRVKDGTWTVDFTARASTWRYRVAEERQDQSYSLSSAGDRALIAAASKGTDREQIRNPFATGEAVFAGSKRALTGLECQKEKATRGALEVDRDTLAIAWLLPGACAMLVDDQGGCHEVRRNDLLGADRAKITSIGTKSVTFTRLAQLPSGYAAAVKRELQLTSKAKPPPGACAKE